VDVLVLRIDAIKIQNHASGGLDLALGIPLLAIGALLARSSGRPTGLAMRRTGVFCLVAAGGACILGVVHRVPGGALRGGLGG
jgi:hypothetical protein